ncbi:testis-specific expressed protein 55 [Saccopteryx leptura]|uniref:testis-specific expressed protein 55 n=1 Tax=Saccopteryx leptura TaxID=249018 RepID=UPI00339C3351
MEDPPEETLGESSVPEITATSPNDSQIDRQEDNWQNLDKEEAGNQTDHRTANQVNGRVSGQIGPNIFGQADHKVSQNSRHGISDQADLRAPNHDNTIDHRAADQVDQRISEQTDSNTSHQRDGAESEDTDSQMPILHEQRTSEYIDHIMSGQADRRTSEPTGRRMSGQADRRTSVQTDRRTSDQADLRAPNHDNIIDHRAADQADQRISEQTDSNTSHQPDGAESEETDSQMPILHEQRASEYIEHIMSGQADRRTSEQTDRRMSGQADQRTELSDYRLSDQMDYKVSVKTRHKVHDQATELADSGTRNAAIDKPDYNSDEVDDLMKEDEDDIEDTQFDYGESSEYVNRVFTRKEDKEDDFRVQPCNFETSQTDFSDFKASVASDMESTNFLQAFKTLDSMFISNLEAKEQVVSPRSPSISTKLDYIINQEKSRLQDHMAEHQEKKISRAQSQSNRKLFPSIVYQDPYQIALKYVEKHHILQIFQQITENLVKELPEDPLSFMLSQFGGPRELRKNKVRDGHRDALCSPLTGEHGAQLLEILTAPASTVSPLQGLPQLQKAAFPG